MDWTDLDGVGTWMGLVAYYLELRWVTRYNFVIQKLKEVPLETVRLTIKGQMVIPARIRHKLGLKRGSKLVVNEIEHGFVVYPLDRNYYEQFAGILKTRGKITKALLEERKKDREHEEKGL